VDITMLIENLSLKVLSGSEKLYRTVSSVYCCDMLSRVMAGALKDAALITVQTHMNVVAVASLIEIACIIFPEGLEAEKDVIDMGTKEGIPILSSELTAYEIAGRLYEMGIGRHESSA